MNLHDLFGSRTIFDVFSFNVGIESCLWSFHFTAQLVIKPCFVPLLP